jgi:hypothetical protein
MKLLKLAGIPTLLVLCVGSTQCRVSIGLFTMICLSIADRPLPREVVFELLKAADLSHNELAPLLGIAAESAMLPHSERPRPDYSVHAQGCCKIA